MNWLNNLNPFAKKLRYSVASQRGPRTENQDNYLVRKPSGEFEMLKDEAPITGKTKLKTKDWWRFAIMDGMGGHDNGRQISERLAEELASAPPATDCDSLKNLILELHDKLYHEFHFNMTESAPGTTLVIAEIGPENQVILAHVGDSRAYLKTKNSWHKITQDHTASTFKKRLNPKQKVLSQANEPLAQAVGFGSFGVFVDDGILLNKYQKRIRLDCKGGEKVKRKEFFRNDVKAFKLPANSQLLLASDGVWHTQNNGELPLPEFVNDTDAFLTHALGAGALDNMSAILLISK